MTATTDSSHANPPAASRHGIIERDGKGGTIRFERLLNHPVPRVWEAVTTPEGLGGWWLPFPATISVDLIVGGQIAFSAMEFGEAPMTCEILEVDPPHRLVHTHFDRSMTIAWELTPEGEGCLLRLTQHTPDIEAAISQGHVVGLHHSLDRLEPALRGNPQPWDWDRQPVLQAEYRDLLETTLGARTPRQRVLDRYVDGFRAGDHAAILACVTDDVAWEIVGHAKASGKNEFDTLIDGPDGAGLPRLEVHNCIEQGDVFAVFGSGNFDGPDGAVHNFRFADEFTFRGDLISSLVSYIVPT